MSYSAKMVFSDSRANALIDRLYYEITKALPAVSLNDICLSGRAAVQLQDNKISGDCNNIILITNSHDIFSFTQGSISNLLGSKGVVKCKERTILYFDFAILEIWLIPGNLHTLTLNGILIQNIQNILPILL